MPFTPLHLGPGLLMKAGLGKRFSFPVFAGTQAVIDLQPLVAMVRGEGVLHGWTHSLAGALGIGMLVAFIAAELAPAWNRSALRRYFRVTENRMTIVVGAGLGALSHVLLDAFMHADLAPGFPFLEANPFLFFLSVDRLHQICVASALAGTVILFLRYRGAFELKRQYHRFRSDSEK